MPTAKPQPDLSMPHLIAAVEAAKDAPTDALVREIDTAAASATEGPPPKDPRDEVEYTFELAYVDGKRRPWPGAFTNKVLDHEMQQRVWALAARFANGASHESLAPNARDMNQMLAHLTISLVDRPAWAKDLRKLHDPGVIYAIYGEVASHEARFLGLDQTPPTQS